MIPVRRAGHNDALEIGEDLLEGYAFLGGRFGQRGGDLPRSDRGHYAIGLRMREVFPDPGGGAVESFPQERRHPSDGVLAH